MAQLAIKGHATRGREVIELLEMLGGVNEFASDGKAIAMADNSWVYYTIDKIDEFIHIIGKSDDRPDAVDWKTFTLEKFLEKFPYKVGDKVQHKGATSCGSVFVVEKLLWEDNQVKYIVNRLWYNNDKVKVTSKDLQPYKEETMEGKLISNEEVSLTIDTSPMEKRQIIFSADAPNETELVLGDNFEIKVEDGKTYVVRKKPQYPKTYEECCEVLNITALDLEILDVRNDRSETVYSKNLDRLLNSFRKLLICRDAYWKIVGEQMGLGKPWVPDFLNPTKEIRYFLFCTGITIENGQALFPTNKILIFPTEEMRDAFYENFKDLIERCKKLL